MRMTQAGNRLGGPLVIGAGFQAHSDLGLVMITPPWAVTSISQVRKIWLSSIM